MAYPAASPRGRLPGKLKLLTMGKITHLGNSQRTNQCYNGVILSTGIWRRGIRINAIRSRLRMDKLPGKALAYYALSIDGVCAATHPLEEAILQAAAASARALADLSQARAEAVYQTTVCVHEALLKHHETYFANAPS